MPVAKAGGLSKQNIREQVYTLLRDRVQRGEITAEHRLVDHEIAAELNVSRMPVREALLQLKNEGYLVGTTRGFVLPRFTPQDIADVFELRLLLEPTAAAGACGRSTVEGLGEMQVAVNDAERAHRKGDVVAYMQANSAFRGAWLDMVPNRHMVQLINRLSDHFQTVRLATLKDKKYRSLSMQRTKGILEAYIKRDVDGVRERVADNLRVAASVYYAQQKLMTQSEHLEGDVAAAPRKRSR